MNEAKRALRAEIARRIASMTGDERRRAGRDACGHLARLGAFERAGTVLAFRPMADEIDTRELIEEALRAGKRLCLPRVDWKRKTMAAVEIRSAGEVELDRRGVPRPPSDNPRVAPEELDLVVVPAKALDRAGNRLGRGGGYYDRFLPAARRAEAVGLAYRCQLVESVPVSEHDVPLGIVVTERGVLTTTAAGRT